MNIKHIILGFALLINFQSNAQTTNEPVKVSGAMSNVMKKGQLQGTVLLDTIHNKKHLYGLGPKEYLKGELLVIDGKSYVSSVNNDGSIKMEETFEVKAPFFVYTNTENWKEYKLPKSIKTLKQLEEFIDKKTKKSNRPFAFKMEGTFTKINFHIQNLPDGTIVKSPKDAHQGQGKYERENVNGTIIGFFSTEHQTVFTHHDTYIHIHFINSERTEMGHIDDLIFDSKSSVRLYITKD
ncbi:Alpha-acetolactate decarboxylase [Elizabethkingia anophelis]|uniref:acetolactate decarboxylase n=1 Tax=Elizabethkingia anophelis TaxID=1117645 RepID=UPI0020B78F04|nr:acetolactate decarboxylase [Elizabethkingia anophelis]UTG65300.1 acetolactate decarboxylase [Elizabethkingia anophelis]CAH1152380.1 Alpha-acetolactate decarboxylase [Elizabethkingia anophelis]CAI9686921.1 Alpha-acetolactate decarboxylase [Elizabethkingia anophelis]